MKWILLHIYTFKVFGNSILLSFGTTVHDYTSLFYVSMRLCMIIASLQNSRIILDACYIICHVSVCLG